MAEEVLPPATDEFGVVGPYPVDVVELHESPSRQGYEPPGRRLSPAEKLTFAAMHLLSRDDELGERIREVARARPACAGLAPGVPTRFMVEHVTTGGHASGACRAWVAEVVEDLPLLDESNVVMTRIDVVATGLVGPPGDKHLIKSVCAVTIYDAETGEFLYEIRHIGVD